MAISAQDVLDAAFLSSLAYQHSHASPTVDGWTLLSYIDLGIPLQQWNNETDDEDNSPYIYDFENAQAIVLRSGDHLAIAFRGTDPVQFLQDLSEGLIDFTSYYSKFATLFTALGEFVSAHDIARVLVTGHSLGAVAAELFMADHLVSVSGETYVAVTFGSPGDPTLTQHDSRILNIGHTGDPIYEFVSESNGHHAEIDLPMDGGISPIFIDHSIERYLETVRIFSASPSATLITSGSWNGFTLVGRDALVDVLAGQGAAEIILGGGGNDVLVGNGGNDVIDGGDGNGDIALFTFASGFYEQPQRYGSKVIVAAKTGVPQVADGTDTLYNVEILRFVDRDIKVSDLPDLSAGTAAGGDASDGGVIPSSLVSNDGSASPPMTGETIVGNDADNHLYGAAGPDVLQGNGGDDIFTGYSGQDTFDGGGGSDTVDYSYNPADVSGTIDLAVGTALFPGLYTEQLTSIENVWMGAGNDVIIGDGGDNDLRGGPGDDILTGGLGNDVIYGDWKYSDHDGNDTAILSYAFGSGYTVSGSANALRIVGAEGDDWYYNVESFEFAGGVMVGVTDVLSHSPIAHGVNAISSIPRPDSETLPNWHSRTPIISANGQYVFFNSDAPNLVPGDTNGRTDVFVMDVSTQAIRRISVASDGTQAADFSSYLGANQLAITPDGRYVAFTSSATNLVPGGEAANGSEIYVKDTITGTVQLASATALGQESNSSDVFPSISSNGRYVIFYSAATNLVAGDSNSAYDVFVKDLHTGAITRVSTDSAGGQAVGHGTTMYGTNAWISCDGRYALFSSDATNLVPADTNGAWDIFRKDLVTGETIRIATYGPLSMAVEGFSISGDERYIAFSRQDGDGNDVDVYVMDLETGFTQLVSTSSIGVEANSAAFHPSISYDGRYVAFNSYADNLVPGDTFGTADVFIKDIQTGAIESPTLDYVLQGALVRPSISANGRYVTFESQTFSPIEAFLVDRSANRSPDALDDTVLTTEKSYLIGNLLIDNGNGADSDLDEDKLALMALNGLEENVGQSVLLPSGALLTVNRDGRFVYDPNGAFAILNAGETATDSFTYTISDGHGNTDTATVTITIHGEDEGVPITGEIAGETLTGTPQDDKIDAAAGDDTVHGGSGFDWLQGGPDNDALYGDADSDVLDGGSGDDLIDGGSGFDTVVYRGNRADYVLTGGRANFAVTDTIAGRDGSDSVFGIEHIVFGDGMFTVADLLPYRAQTDLTGDGTSDILWYRASNRAVGAFEMDTGSAVWANIGTAGAGWTVVAKGDITGDGTSDIVWYNSTTRAVGAFQMDTSTAVWTGIGKAGTGWAVVDVGDVTGDGAADIVWYNSATRAVGMFEMDTGSSVWSGIGKAGTGWALAAVGDLTGDGTDDIIWFNAATKSVGMFKMDSGSAAWTGIGKGGSGWAVAGTGDFTGDGKEDLLWNHTSSNAVGMHVMDSGSAVWQAIGNAGSSWMLADTGDYNGDGTTDILWQNATTNAVSMFQMDEGHATWVAIGTGGTGWDVV